jgi:DNA-binding SARP family transcriptional activator
VPAVALTLLGPPSVSLEDGLPITALAGSKCLALLTFLVLEEGPHGREELAALLWGESPDDAARASLRQAVHKLRLLLGPVVHADHSSVRLAAPVACDVTAFRQALRTDPLAAAGFDIPRFMSGFAIRNAPAFADWVASTRAGLLRHYQRALAAVAREAMEQWRWRDATDWAERWLASDPLSDEAARIVVEALYLGGDRGAALARHAAYRDRFIEETGCTPSRALQTLVHRIENDAELAAARPISEERFAQAPAFEAGLVGREAPLRLLQQIWRRAERGRGGIVLIEGETGVGKSRVAGEFLRWAIAAGATGLRGRAYDAQAAVPYGPVVEALRGVIDAAGVGGAAPEALAEAARLVPELRQRFTSLPAADVAAGPAEAWHTFEAVAQVLLAIAAEQPIVVVLDDVHWCDADSCGLVRFLSRRLEGAPVLWILTLTPGELERDAPAARLCRVLRAKAHAAAIQLDPLSPDEVAVLLREMGHVGTATGARRFAHRLHGVTGGNPFYIVELLKTLFARGLLTTTTGAGDWSVAAATALELDGDLPMPSTVHDTIAERVDRLPDPLRDVLATIAAAGAGVRADVVSHVHGISRLHAAALGDALVDRRLAIEAGGAYRCAHPVIGRVVVDALTAPRRREVHRALAAALELALSPEAALAAAPEIARHADIGGHRELAYRHALHASAAAVDRCAYEEALAWLDLAAASATGQTEVGAVDARTADVLEAAGWREAPPHARILTASIGAAPPSATI